jgi:antitoxin component YwqK of YwqJK toxin-antitoxin module
MNSEIKLLFLSLAILLGVCCSCHEDVPKTKYYPNGSIEEKCYLRNGKLSGDYKYYHSNGNVCSEGQFKKGHPIGVWCQYYPSGKTMSIVTYSRKGSIININAWDENGKHVVQNGTGTFVKYYSNGSLESIVTYKDCRFDGVNTNWYPNGKKMEEIIYKNGKPVGIWRFWNNEGELVREEKY